MFWARTWLLSGRKGWKHRSPHELCSKICYCSWPPNIAVAPVALHSVAHTVSQQIPAIYRCRGGVALHPAHIPKKTLSHPSCHPSVTVSRGNCLAKTDRATQGCSSYTHTNRATVCHYDRNTERIKVTQKWLKSDSGRPTPEWPQFWRQGYFPFLGAQRHRKYCNTNWRCALQYKLEIYHAAVGNYCMKYSWEYFMPNKLCITSSFTVDNQNIVAHFLLFVGQD